MSFGMCGSDEGGSGRRRIGPYQFRDVEVLRGRGRHVFRLKAGRKAGERAQDFHESLTEFPRE